MLSPSSRRGPRALLLAFALLALAGCGGRSSVQGTVTLDGNPVDGGGITFTPQGGGPQTGGQIVGGKYTIPSHPGLAPGSYRVDITWKKPTGKKVPTPGDPGTTIDETVQAIPPKYNTQSTLTADVKSGSNTADFALTSR